ADDDDLAIPLNDDLVREGIAVGEPERGGAVRAERRVEMERRVVARDDDLFGGVGSPTCDEDLLLRRDQHVPRREEGWRKWPDITRSRAYRRIQTGAVRAQQDQVLAAGQHDDATVDESSRVLRHSRTHWPAEE